MLNNKDLSYLIGGIADRFDYQNADKIRRYLKRMNLQLTYEVDGYLFSHSGVLPSWLCNNKLKLEDLKTISFSHYSLLDVSPYRGGSKDGSCIWGDIREYMFREHIPNLFQIFGHTQLKQEIISQDFACLDCRKAFVLDTETKSLKAWEEEN